MKKTEIISVLAATYSRLGFTVLLFGLVLWSCDKEVAGGGTADGKIEVRFSLEAGAYQGSDVTRSLAVPVSETVTAAMGDDLYLTATLSASPSEGLRAASSPVKENSKVRIVAYQNSIYQVHADYTVSGSSLVPDGTPLSLVAGTYDFVAYTFHNEDPLPGYAEMLEKIDPKNDVLWGSQSAVVSGSSLNVALTLRHLFSRVSVSANTSLEGNESIAAISAEVSPGYYANLTSVSGIVVAHADSATQSLTIKDGLSTSEVTFESRTVYMSGSTPTTVKINSVVIGGKEYASSKVEFSQALEAGKAYTVTVKLRKDPNSGKFFAASNIYWDGTKLTFDPYTANPSQESMQKQGVTFKWGSLIGISNAGTGTQGYSWGNSNIVYIPTGKTSPTSWTSKTLTQAVSDGNWTVAGWDGIPYVQTTVGTAALTFLTANFKDAKDSTLLYKGDICWYINKEYRMPTRDEFLAIIGTSGYDNSALGSTTNYLNIGVNTDGQNLITTGATGANGMFFPASGYRQGSNGTNYYIGRVAYYWTNSYFNATSAYFLDFGNASSAPEGKGFVRPTANPVRCVLK